MIPSAPTFSESTARSVQRVLPTYPTIEGAGFAVRRPFPVPGLSHIDPFLLLDHLGPFDAPPGEAKGAPDHPHRGFETVTYLLEGEMEHKDSAGNAGRLTPGDVQWMTAGAGVVHSEMPSARVQREGGRIHGVQLWVNLPRSAKMKAPRYQEIPAARIPVARKDGATVRVIAGEAYGKRAVIDTHTPILYFHVSLEAGARFEEKVPPGFTVMAYVLSGEVRAGSGQSAAQEGELVLFASDGAKVSLAAASPSEVLIVGGAPLREPVARYGPFVMNTQAELLQAFDDYRAGRMGAIASE